MQEEDSVDSSLSEMTPPTQGNPEPEGGTDALPALVDQGELPTLQAEEGVPSVTQLAITYEMDEYRGDTLPNGQCAGHRITVRWARGMQSTGSYTIDVLPPTYLPFTSDHLAGVRQQALRLAGFQQEDATPSAVTLGEVELREQQLAVRQGSVPSGRESRTRQCPEGGGSERPCPGEGNPEGSGGDPPERSQRNPRAADTVALAASAAAAAAHYATGSASPGAIYPPRPICQCPCENSNVMRHLPLAERAEGNYLRCLCQHCGPGQCRVRVSAIFALFTGAVLCGECRYTHGLELATPGSPDGGDEADGDPDRESPEGPSGEADRSSGHGAAGGEASGHGDLSPPEDSQGLFHNPRDSDGGEAPGALAIVAETPSKQRRAKTRRRPLSSKDPLSKKGRQGQEEGP